MQPTTTHPLTAWNLPIESIDDWIAQENAVRVRMDTGAGPGVATREHISNKTGLEQMQAMLQGELPFPTIATPMEFTMIDAQKGSVVMQGAPGGNHLNPMGSIHGGWYATLLDSAMGCAVHTMLPVGYGYTTAELSINYVRALHPRKTPRARVQGTVLHFGKQLATAHGVLYGPDGTVFAHGTTTCLVFEMKS